MIWSFVVGFVVSWFVANRMRRRIGAARTLYAVAAFGCGYMTFMSIRHEVATGVWRASIAETLADDRVWAASTGTVLWIILMIVCAAGAIGTGKTEGSG